MSKGKIAKSVAEMAAELSAKAKRPEVSRIDMGFKDVTKRMPALTEAANLLREGKLTREQYAELVNRVKPVTPYDFVPKPATAEEAIAALTSNKKGQFGKSVDIRTGERADLRLDIPSYSQHGVWVNSIHRKDAPTVYSSTSAVKNAEMIPSADKALKVATGDTPKAPFAVIRGEWNPLDEESTVKTAQEYLKHKDWRQVGYDPERHGYFYDRETMAPIIGADEVIQIGPLVLAKKPRYGSDKDFPFKNGGAVRKAEGGAATSNEAMLRRSRRTSKYSRDVDWLDAETLPEEQPPAEMKAYEPTTRQRLGESAERALRKVSPAPRARAIADLLTGGREGAMLSAADFVPFLGTGMAVEEIAPNVKEALSKGNYGEAALYGGLGAATAIPGIPGTLKAAKAAGKAIAPKAGELALQYMMRTGMALPMDAWHGSPHRFPPTAKNPLGEFDPKRIGTGEGAQMYGIGHYLAESPNVAKRYTPRDEKYESKLLSMYNRAEARGDYDSMEVLESAMMHSTPEELRKSYPNAAKLIDQIAKIPQKGSLYKVDLPDEQIVKMLDWDKPFKRHPQEIREILDNVPLRLDMNKPSHLKVAEMIDNPNPAVEPDVSGLYSALSNALGSSEAASNYLKEMGIPGIKYLDEASRDAGKGTSNFVVFPGNEDILTIKERMKKGGPVSMDAMRMAVGGMAGGGRSGAVKGVFKKLFADRDVLPAVESGSARLSREVGTPEGIKSLSFEDYAPNEVELVNLEALQQGKGYGSSAMNKITSAADKNKINMMLIPAGDEAKRARLSDFYGRFGFSEDGDVMRRNHKAGGGKVRKSISLDAMRLAVGGGVRKALTRTVEEARRLHEAAQKTRSKAAQEAAGLYHPIGGGVKLSKPTELMTATTIDDPTIKAAPRKIVTLEDLQGGVAIPLVGDRAAAGRILQDVEGQRLKTPVKLQGGPGFMQTHTFEGQPEKSAAWASGKGVVSALGNQTRRAVEMAGTEKVYAPYVAMSPTGVDYNTMISRAILGQLDVDSLSKRAIQSFNREVRKVEPRFVGVESPQLEAQLFGGSKEAGPIRKAFVDRMGLEKFRQRGFPDVAATRKAITEPELLHEELGSTGYNIARLDPEGRIVDDPLIPHETYPIQLRGEYFGSLEDQVPYRDFFQGFSDKRRAFGNPQGSDWRAFSMSAPIQQLDQEWLDRVMKSMGKDKPREWKKGGQVKRMAEGGQITADDLVVEERKL
jgi:hypothetical protein